MEVIIKTLLGKTSDTYVKYIEDLLSEERREILNEQEKDMLEYLYVTYDESDKFPTQNYFLKQFPEYSIPLDSSEPLQLHDLEIHYKKMVKKRSKQVISRKVMQVSSKITDEGFTDEVHDELSEIYKLNRDVELDESVFDISVIREIYELKKQQPLGLQTYINEIDEKIGGLSSGTVNVVLAWTGSYKCISEDERVPTSKGLLTMKDIYVRFSKGERFKVLSEEGSRDIVHAHDEGRKKSYILSTERGNKIEISPVHRFKVINKLGVIEWRMSEDIKVGDKLLLTKRESLWGDLEVDNDYAYLVGKHSGTNALPEWVFKAKKKYVASLLRGLFDTDGSTSTDKRKNNITLTTISKKVAYEVSTLLRNFGIRVSVNKYRYKDNNPYYHVRIITLESKLLFLEEIGMSSTKKRDRLLLEDNINNREILPNTLVKNYHPTIKFIVDNDAYIEEVVSKEESECYMYDLTVEGSPTYVVNNFITHNTTFAINIGYNNTYKMGYNVVYISLEVPKEDIIYNILSRHSFDSKFTKYPYIGHRRIRQCELNPEEEEFVFEEVLNDFMEEGKGDLVILDETDFKSFTFPEIRKKLEEVDERIGGIDAIIWDHANLFKFSESDKRLSQNDIINEYVSWIRQIGIKWVKDEETGNYRQLTNIILAQANRQGWKKADKNGGRYDLTAIAEANELERCAYRVLALYTNEDLKQSKEVLVQILKNRSGPTLYEPVSVFADPVPYVIGDEMEGFSDVISTDSFSDVFGNDDLDF